MVSWHGLSSACWDSELKLSKPKSSHKGKSQGHPLASPAPTHCLACLGPPPIGHHPSMLVAATGIVCGRRSSA